MESLIGEKLLDREGDPIGKITDVIYDSTTLERDWITVKTGLLDGEHLVPASALQEGNGPVVPFPREQVKKAPVIGKGHAAPSDSESRSVYEHYGMEAEAS